MLYTLFYLVAVLLLCSPAVFAQNNTCPLGSEPTPRSWNSTEIGRYCGQYSNKPSCCTQKLIDNTIDAASSAYPSIRRCAVRPSFTDSCAKAFYPITCLEICASNEMMAKYVSGGSLKLCKAYAEVLFDACKDYRVCNMTQACGNSEEFVDGCSTYANFYPNAQAFVTARGYTFVDAIDSPVGTCFSGGSTKELSWALLIILAVVTFFVYPGK